MMSTSLKWLLLLSLISTAHAENVFVTLEKDNALAIVDPIEGKLLKTVPVGQRPRGIALSPDNKHLYIAPTAAADAGWPNCKPPATARGRRQNISSFPRVQSAVPRAQVCESYPVLQPRTQLPKSKMPAWIRRTSPLWRKPETPARIKLSARRATDLRRAARPADAFPKLRRWREV